MVSILVYIEFVKKRSNLMLLYLSGYAQVMKAIEKYQYMVWEKLKCLD